MLLTNPLLFVHYNYIKLKRLPILSKYEPVLSKGIYDNMVPDDSMLGRGEQAMRHIKNISGHSAMPFFDDIESDSRGARHRGGIDMQGMTIFAEGGHGLRVYALDKSPMTANHNWLGLAWLGLAWLGLAWLGLAWLGLAWMFMLT